MFGRPAYSGRTWHRRLIALAVVLSLCASFFPLPVRTVHQRLKDLSQPFPCQSRPCGCESAEQCWKQCCCFSNAEKIAWARENGVNPPQYVVEAAAAEEAENHTASEKLAKKSCPHCTQSKAEEEENVASVQSTRRCACSSATHSQCEHHGQATEPSGEAFTTVVIGIEMLKCRGQGLFWNSLPWAVIPAAEVPVFRVESGAWARPRSTTACSVATEPPEPPPRPGSMPAHV